MKKEHEYHPIKYLQRKLTVNTFMQKKSFIENLEGCLKTIASSEKKVTQDDEFKNFNGHLIREFLGLMSIFTFYPEVIFYIYFFQI